MREHLGGPLAGFLFGHAVELQRQGDVFQGRERGNQVERLEDEADAAAAEQRPLVVAEAGVVDAFEQDLAGGRRFDRAENASAACSCRSRRGR